MKRITWQQWIALITYLTVMLVCVCAAMTPQMPPAGMSELRACLIQAAVTFAAIAVAGAITFVYIRLGIFRAISENLDG